VQTVRVERVVLREVSMPLLSLLETGYGRQSARRFLLLEAHAGGLWGYGECCAMEGPWYREETVGTARSILTDVLVPLLLQRSFEHPAEVAGLFRRVRRNHMARAAAESACWDLFAQARAQPLHRLLGGTRTRVDAGVAVGLQPNPAVLVRVVEGYLAQGYRRVKIKITPGRDLTPVAELRRALGDVPLAVDANASYTLPDDLPLLEALDGFGLLMIEQPLPPDDLAGHAHLQEALATPICLDESIDGAADARRAVEMGACRVVNVKAARLGGLQGAREVHDVCAARGVPVWCGGMLESGLGRSHNIALASLPGFTLPGHLSASGRYWARDIIAPPVTVAPDGTIAVPGTPGRGFDVDVEALDAFTLSRQAFPR
jgi:O-succinylbenzoate synthase